ncbi:hypothetical protein NEDG_00352 [Nematocida displodere]|uniref:Uncharacterized protein n=1 Tax=Nematocida displodere TaxID=1805483 RepID=A0A177EIW9_9MICR|nr:hypothetical protein NEDG_00352 [Nematocida displodere]
MLSPVVDPYPNRTRTWSEMLEKFRNQHLRVRLAQRRLQSLQTPKLTLKSALDGCLHPSKALKTPPELTIDQGFAPRRLEYATANDRTFEQYCFKLLGIDLNTALRLKKNTQEDITAFNRQTDRWFQNHCLWYKAYVVDLSNECAAMKGTLPAQTLARLGLSSRRGRGLLEKERRSLRLLSMLVSQTLTVDQYLLQEQLGENPGFWGSVRNMGDSQNLFPFMSIVATITVYLLFVVAITNPELVYLPRLVLAVFGPVSLFTGAALLLLGREILEVKRRKLLFPLEHPDFWGTLGRFSVLVGSVVLFYVFFFVSLVVIGGFYLPFAGVVFSVIFFLVSGGKKQSKYLQSDLAYWNVSKRLFAVLRVLSTAGLAFLVFSGTTKFLNSLENETLKQVSVRYLTKVYYTLYSGGLVVSLKRMHRVVLGSLLETAAK